ncbi:hypothetical protein Bhyg_03796 [Pseudolycoriella hygida]|uniref:Uncharacterized protein n=1 Tax=Pseudolycoriella hygida TaxID=35572 RepID=A0A9Q0NDY4_9DIPT|nr:hypothetical protein Bhyg_03796 [Pseudolycoriella hygida]
MRSDSHLNNVRNHRNVSSIEFPKEGNDDSLKVKDVKEKDSLCTNFTNDSGSFIVAQNEKLYLDRLQLAKKTSTSKTVKETRNFDVYLRPYEVLPLQEAKKLIQRDSKLVPTFDIKERLKVEVRQFHSERIGVRNKKYLSQLATEWDEYYQKEILNRPRIRRFKPRTIMKQVIDSLRLKYESTYKREYLTEQSIIIEQEKLLIKQAEDFRDFCMSFFSNLTTTSYRQSMAKIQDLRPIYELNDELTAELTVLHNKLIQLETAIIRAEGKFREAIILQNVSYLMKEPNWREKNDWIHKRDDGSLETIKESIENRMTTNLRKRDSDSVWAIKEFFENNIFNNQRPALVCFKSPDDVNETITNLKVQLYLSLLKLDLSTWTLTNLKHAFNSYEKWSTDFIEHRRKYVEARCARKYFLDSSATNMKKDAEQLIDEKLMETISEKTLRTLEPLCITLFVSVVPKNAQEQLEGSDVLSKFRLIISHAMDMLEQIDAIPSVKRKEIENNIRKENGFIQRRSQRAVDLEAHINKAKHVMMKHSSPPFKRPPRTGKLPRSYLEVSKEKSSSKIKPVDESGEIVNLTLTERDFEEFLQGSPIQNDYYLDATFFGGDPEVPNMDFLPEMKSNINEFIVDVKNLLGKWEQNKQERYLEDAHHIWTSNYNAP